MVEEGPRGETLVERCGPIVVMYHPCAPSEARAAQECVAIEAQVREGGRGLIVVLGELLPPPSVGALRHYRRLLKEIDGLEAVAIVLATGESFASSITLSLVRQLFHLTRLSGAARNFPRLEAAVDWVEERLGEPLDAQEVAEVLARLGADVEPRGEGS